MSLVLVQLLGVVLLAGSGPNTAAGWVVLMTLLRLCLSIWYRPYASTDQTGGMLHALDVASCCGLVGSSTAYLYMASNASNEHGGGRSLDCETMGWLGSGILACVELVVACCIVFAQVRGVRKPDRRV